MKENAKKQDRKRIRKWRSEKKIPNIFLHEKKNAKKKKINATDENKVKLEIFEGKFGF